jgi:Domain of unknown function (DUF4864)
MLAGSAGRWCAGLDACDHECVGHKGFRAVKVAGISVLLAMTVLAGAGSPGAAEEVMGGAADLVLKQIALLRAHDFAAAYALVSRELRRTFSPSEFEWMVKRAHPEVANSTRAYVVRTHEAAGFVYVTVKVQGRNGQHAEALYEIVREGDGFRVNALSSRRDEGTL